MEKAKTKKLKKNEPSILGIFVASFFCSSSFSRANFFKKSQVTGG